MRLIIRVNVVYSKMHCFAQVVSNQVSFCSVTFFTFFKDGEACSHNSAVLFITPVLSRCQFYHSVEYCGCR